ncbi:fused MFS/spermidine synthase [Brevibacterium daeguense]|uniref:Fused MFS/spermidine synthase n=1 Tax=Brevibacterium daeguense TaxID=909936 RepID=A0ABP8EMS4_9MICO|nr:fused MFS/spermidine synthase [Brevibacterium daeguense]
MGRKRAEAAPEEVEVPIATGTARLEPVPGDAESWVLYVNGVPSSSITIGDPLRLDFEYLDWMSRVVDTVFPHPATLRAVHIGAAGCALPRWIDAARPGSRQTAVEIDPELARLVRRWFDLPRSPALALRIGDGAVEIAAFRDQSITLVVRDAFDHDTTPQQLASPEFFGDVSRVLTEDGLYLANVADRPPHHGLRAELKRMAEHFPWLAVVADPGQLRGRRWGNVVAIAAHQPLDEVAIAKVMRRGPAVASVLAGRQLRAFIGD